LRALFVVLLLANIGVAGYAWYASSQPNPDAALLNQQLNAEKIRITGARPAVLPARPKGACLEWGSFGAGELKPAQAALEPLKLGNRVTWRDVQVLVGFWVYIPPLNSKSEVNRKIAELESLGVQEYYAVEGQRPMKNAISLGIFKTEEAANNRLEELRQKGVRLALVGRREQRVTQTAFLVREPDAAVSAALAQLRAQFPGTELKSVQCAG
jgi:hypothetical protein